MWVRPHEGPELIRGEAAPFDVPACRRDHAAQEGDRMKWYWIALLVVVGLVLLLAVVGALLPVKHQAACRAVLRQPAAAVFELAGIVASRAIVRDITP